MTITCTHPECTNPASVECRTEYHVIIHHADGGRSEKRWGSGDGMMCIPHAQENGWIDDEDIAVDGERQV